MFCFSLQDAVYLLSLWFSFCGLVFGAYWHFLSVETVSKLFKLFYSKWETNFCVMILGSIKHPTPRMAKNLFMLYFNPYASGAPASDDLSVSEKKEDMLFFHSI